MTSTKLKLPYTVAQNREYYKAFALRQSAGKAIICLNDKIVIYGEGGKQETLPVKPLKAGKPVEYYGNYEWHPNSKDPYQGWLLLHGAVYYVPNFKNQNIESWQFFKLDNVWNLVTSEDGAIASTGKHNLTGVWLRLGKPNQAFDIPGVRNDDSLILVGEKLYVGFKNGEGFAEVDLNTGKLVNKSDGLNLTDASGNNPNKSPCVLTFDSATKTLYAETQHGHYQKIGDKWQEINPAWHGGNISVVDAGEVILTARQGTLLYKVKEDKYYPQKTLHSGYTRAVVKVGNDLISFVRHGGEDESYFAPYFLSTPIQNVPRKEVTKIQELPVFQSQDAVKLNSKLYVASKGSGLVEIDGDKVKTLSTEPTLAVALTSNEVFTVTAKSITKYNPATAEIKTVKTLDKGLNSARIAATAKYTAVVENLFDNGNQFVVYDTSYKEVFRWGETDTYLFDVQIDGDEIYVAGFVQRQNAEVMAYGKLAKNVPVQVFFLKVFDASKNFAVTRSCWNFDPNTLDDYMADTRLYRIVLSEEHGKKLLRCFGESHGGNTVAKTDGQKLGTNTLHIGSDWYGHAVQTGDTPIQYVCVLDAKTLTVISGQLILARDNAMQGATLRAKNGSFFVKDGEMFAGGMAAYKVQGRDSRKILGEYLPKYGTVPGDASLLTLTLSTGFVGSRKDWLAIAPADDVKYFDGEVALIEYKGQLKKVSF